MLHERVIFLTVVTEKVPTMPKIDQAELRVFVEPQRLIMRCGFKDEPDLPLELSFCKPPGLPFDRMKTPFYLNRETILPGKLTGITL